MTDNDIIALLWDYLKRDPEHKDRRQTGWGTKTQTGLVASVRRVAERDAAVIEVKAALLLAVRNGQSRLYMLPADDSGNLDRDSLKSEIAIYQSALEALDKD